MQNCLKETNTLAYSKLKCVKIQRESFIRFAREREMSNHAFNQNLPGTCYEVQMNLEDLEDFCLKKIFN